MIIIIKLIKKLLKRSRNEPKPHAEHVIPRKEHCISKTDLDPNVLKVLNRLDSAKFQAFLVGGSVRDLLLRKSPKDFDVATNAKPQEIRNLFRNARIIGRRFKLVHILFQRDIIEVATFRAKDSAEEAIDQKTNERGMLVRDNVYGTLEEDAFRRDFTINSLYYNMHDASILDLTGGVKDIKNRLVRMIGDPVLRYQEDPVRMLRAVRFCAKLHFQLAPETAAPIPGLAHLITHVSSSRLFDEMTKLYQCGEAESAQRLLSQQSLFPQLFPWTQAEIDKNQQPVNAFLGIALESTDARIRDDKPVTPAFIFAVLLWFPMLSEAAKLQEKGIDPLPALDQAMSFIIAEQNRIVCVPKRFTQIMREIWLLQFRLDKRHGERAFHLLEHPRFRAAYDFMALRALAGDAPLELAQWWTNFQDSDDEQRHAMVTALKPPPSKKRKRKKKTGISAP